MSTSKSKNNREAISKFLGLESLIIVNDGEVGQKKFLKNRQKGDQKIIILKLN